MGGEAVLDITVVADADAAGRLVAGEIAALLRDAAPGRRIVLGCPAGRTPRTTYDALGALAVDGMLDFSRLEVVMMDEYVDEIDGRHRLVSPEAGHSCRRFAEQELRAVLNRGLPSDRQLPADQVHGPDPDDPDAYEDLIERLGGVDLFVLAAGGSDGHVAFNPPGSPADSRTRVVALAEETRRDNMGTFPSLEHLEQVPRFGVTVGLGTIARHSAAVVLLLLGAGKRTAYRRLVDAGGFDPSWPATIVWACPGARVVADEAAADPPQLPKSW